MSSEIESEHPAYTLTQFSLGPGQLGLQITAPHGGDYVQLPVVALRSLVRDLTRYIRDLDRAL